ncbi:hypothetical protein [Paraburkholderia domus]|uniref:hypothetical protein n=1 Tax=Paraburkholderia domus TaxID=2793075 RepID=UPI0019144949|nr:hypothetical protein [Paraburkholderia domus]MBK5050045.1 hypothetical protein [Burkholderia sp. R-70006]MBK5064261.1 hypothetical protein [Burkholderia sp. R-70199]MBK5086780.1 hypothetical protein [Burkholderia sp. R-69927]MBK5121503.1 hypothetical protein [Burkholderia sp. R-69980]MBK5166646.1 hypothetical protein [Burkholderia sp. R-70211]MBK5185328.1 hypothetical protein [Burkholderia sp. R-69749]MCI0147213.1 hypothetical protein [Paraburkholderia sediminicola]
MSLLLPALTVRKLWNRLAMGILKERNPGMKLCLRKPPGTAPGAALNRLMFSRHGQMKGKFNHMLSKPDVSL